MEIEAYGESRRSKLAALAIVLFQNSRLPVGSSDIVHQASSVPEVLSSFLRPQPFEE